MKVRVRFFSYFVFLSGAPEGVLDIETEGTLSVEDICGRYGVKKDYIALVTINGRHINLNDEDKLSDGDYVEIYPLFGGG